MSNVSKRQKSSVGGGDDAGSFKVLVFDATVPEKPEQYVVDVEADARKSVAGILVNPVARRLANILRRNLNQTGQDVYECVAVGGEDAGLISGLISENSEDPENDLDEIITYFQMNSDVKFRPSLHCREGAIQATISLAGGGP